MYASLHNKGLQNTITTKTCYFTGVFETVLEGTGDVPETYMEGDTHLSSLKMKGIKHTASTRLSLKVNPEPRGTPLGRERKEEPPISAHLCRGHLKHLLLKKPATFTGLRPA